jgi:hypothetical protein
MLPQFTRQIKLRSPVNSPQAKSCLSTLLSLRNKSHNTVMTDQFGKCNGEKKLVEMSNTRKLTKYIQIVSNDQNCHAAGAYEKLQIKHEFSTGISDFLTYTSHVLTVCIQELVFKCVRLSFRLACADGNLQSSGF